MKKKYQSTSEQKMKIRNTMSLTTKMWNYLQKQLFSVEITMSHCFLYKYYISCKLVFSIISSQKYRKIRPRKSVGAQMR